MLNPPFFCGFPFFATFEPPAVSMVRGLRRRGAGLHRAALPGALEGRGRQHLDRWPAILRKPGALAQDFGWDDSDE